MGRYNHEHMEEIVEMRVSVCVELKILPCESLLSVC